jgi:putative membrane protein
MDLDPIWHNLISAVVFSAMGLAIYIVGFILFDRLTPQVHIWREISENKNVALAIFLGSIVLGIALIISAAIHG